MSSFRTFTSTGQFVVEDCCRQGCGIAFGIPRDLYDRLRADTGTVFYCPNGHGQSYTGKSDAQKLRDAEARETHLKDQLEAAEAEAESRRGQILRDRVRFAAGVCPCCNRSFPQIRRHIATKHPTYDPTSLSGKKPRFECSCGMNFKTFQGLRIHQGRSRPAGWTNPKMSKWNRHLSVVDAR